MKRFAFSPCFFLALFAVMLFSTIVSAQSERLVSGVPPEHPDVVEGVKAALKGDNEAADRFFAEAVKKQPGGRPGGIDAAMAFTDSVFDFQFYSKMRFWLERTAENYPEDPEAFFLLADIALFENRCLECSMLVRHGLEVAETLDANLPRKRSMQVYGEKITANLAEHRQRWSEAVARYEKLRELEPENADHLYRLGLALFRLDRREEAIKSLDEAEAKDKRLLPAQIVLARLSESEGKTDDAVRFVKEALEKSGKDVRVLSAAADLELKWDRLDKARELAEKARKIDSMSADPIIVLGFLDLYDGKYEEAEDKFMLVTESLPDETRALTGLALALCEQKDSRQLRRAFSVAKKNVDGNPDSVDAQTTLAWVLVKTDSLDEAEKILLRHFDAGELNSPGAYYLAVLFFKQNRKDEARKFLKAALETKVNFPKRIEARRLLQALEQESN